MTPTQSTATSAGTPRRVQVLPRPVKLSSISDLDVVSVLPSVPAWRAWFGTTTPQLIADQPLEKGIEYARAMGDLAKFVLARARPGLALTLSMVSPLAQDGRSTVAANLAVTCAAMRKKVLLTDADLHQRALGGVFTTAVRPLGISNVLKGAVYWRDLVSPHDFYPNLQFLPAGSAEFSDDLPARQLRELLEETKPFYDLVLLDSAPLLQHPQSIDLVVASDATLLLARRSHTRQSELSSALSYLRRLESRVLAIALNDA